MAHEYAGLDVGLASALDQAVGESTVAALQQTRASNQQAAQASLALFQQIQTVSQALESTPLGATVFGGNGKNCKEVICGKNQRFMYFTRDTVHAITHVTVHVITATCSEDSRQVNSFFTSSPLVERAGVPCWRPLSSL